MQSLYLGMCSYSTGIEKQNTYLLNEEIVLGMEHPKTLSLGKRASEQDLLYSKKDLYAKGFCIESSDRGGQATLHNPGQLVIYPILDLKKHNLGVRDFVCLLQKTTHLFLSEFQIRSFSQGEPGIYTKQGKIASIGLKIQHSWTSHGIALNHCNDLKDFSVLKNCGVLQQKFDKINNYSDLNIEPCFEIWVQIFSQCLTDTDFLLTCKNSNERR